MGGAEERQAKQMSALLKFRFHWRANGKDHETIIEAPSYPEACYKLAQHHSITTFRHRVVPDDFAMDLTQPEPVE